MNGRRYHCRACDLAWIAYRVAGETRCGFCGSEEIAANPAREAISLKDEEKSMYPRGSSIDTAESRNTVSSPNPAVRRRPYRREPHRNLRSRSRPRLALGDPAGTRTAQQQGSAPGGGSQYVRSAIQGEIARAADEHRRGIEPFEMPRSAPEWVRHLASALGWVAERDAEGSRDDLVDLSAIALLWLESGRVA